MRKLEPPADAEDHQPRRRHVLVQDTGNSEALSEVILRGVDTTRSDDGSQTRLTADLLIGGDATARLEHLVSRLSLEPGIYGVHWHSAGEPALALALAVSGEESGSPDEE